MFGQKGVLKKGHLRQPWKSVVVVAAIVALVFLSGFLLLSPHLSLDRGSPVQCVNVEDTLGSELGGRLGRIVNPRIPLNGGNKLDENLGSRELGRPKLLGVVGIQTGFDMEERRKSLRETWMPSTTEGIARLEESTGLAFRFVIGHTKDAWKTAALDREISQYRDFLRIDIEEDYHRLKYKTYPSREEMAEDCPWWRAPSPSFLNLAGTAMPRALASRCVRPSNVDAPVAALQPYG